MVNKIRVLFFLMALILVASKGLVFGAHDTAPASENFSDVPSNQWAYEAVEKLKGNGILTGYPDGLYRGARIATRYEMAHAIYGAWSKLKGMYDGLESQITSLNDKINGLGNVAAEVKDLRNQMEAVQKELAGMKTYGEDIANLKKLADTFKAELEKMGVDVTEMKKELSALESRVKKLEERRYTVAISGDANFLMLGGHGATKRGSDDGGARESTYGITSNGRLTGVPRGSRDPFAGPVTPGEGATGMNEDLSAFYELALSFSSTNPSEALKWRGTLVGGNMLSEPGNIPSHSGLGNQSSYLIGRAFREPNMDLYVQDLVFSGGSKWGSVGLDVDFGRFGYQIDPYMFKRPAYNDLYYKNPRWSNGNYYLDGGLLKFMFGEIVDLHIFGGRTADRNSVNGVDLDPMFINAPFENTTPYVYPVQPVNQTKVSQMLGARLRIPIQKIADINFAYLMMDTNSPIAANIADPLVTPAGTATTINRQVVWGGTANVNLFKGLNIHGGYAKTPYQYNGRQVYDKHNTAGWAKISYATPMFGVGVGYRQIDKNYNAPGDWGKIGLFYNPIDVRGFSADAFVNLAKLRLSAETNLMQGRSDAVKDTHLNSFTGKAEYWVKPAWNLWASYEAAQFNPHTTVERNRMQWITVGSGYNFSKRASLNLGYQYSDTTALNTAFPLIGLDTASTNASKVFGEIFRGGLAFAHFMYRF